jgi:hypothetical protein
MSDFEEITVAALQSLFDQVETMQHIDVQDIQKPDMYSLYEMTLQAAYDGLTAVEDALTTLGMELEQQHFRLSVAVEVLEPLLNQTLSSYDLSIEVVENLLAEIL